MTLILDYMLYRAWITIRATGTQQSSGALPVW